MEHDKICDVRGPPFTMDVWKRSLVISALRDGDKGTLLTENTGGYPMIQSIPAHRIGWFSSEAVVEGGEFDGARMIDGVIVNDYGRPMAYRIYDETGDEFTDFSANDMLLTFLPDWDDQARGISALAASAFDWQDIAEARRLELLSQKLNASIGMIEENETGEADENGGLTIPATTGTEIAGVRLEKASGGLEVRYFKAGAGQGLKPMVNDRPTANQKEFSETIIRSALNGIGWSPDFSLDPSKVGGASMRVVVAKINSTIGILQRFILSPACRRVDGWRISKAIELGLLPDDPDWFKWKYQGPAKITADEKYQSSVSIEEMRSNLTSLKTEAEKRGGFWEDVQDDAIEVEKRLQARCKAEGVDPNRIMIYPPGTAPVNEASSAAQSPTTP
jgi:capsid protein